LGGENEIQQAAQALPAINGSQIEFPDPKNPMNKGLDPILLKHAGNFDSYQRLALAETFHRYSVQLIKSVIMNCPQGQPGHKSSLDLLVGELKLRGLS
jgi:hypothetical protein